MLGQQNVRLAIVGNKVDLQQTTSAAGEQQQSALVQEAMQLADELFNARHYLTSAKHNQGIDELFVSLARRMVEQHKRTALARAQLASANSRISRRTISLAGGEEEEEERHSQVGVSRTANRNNGANSCQC